MNTPVGSSLVWWTMDYRPTSGRWFRGCLLAHLALVVLMWAMIPVGEWVRKAVMARYEATGVYPYRLSQHLAEIVAILFFLASLALAWSLIMLTVWGVKLHRGLMDVTQEGVMAPVAVGFFTLVPMLQLILIPLLLWRTCRAVERSLPLRQGFLGPSKMALYSLFHLAGVFLISAGTTGLAAIFPGAFGIIEDILRTLPQWGEILFAFTLFQIGYLGYFLPLWWSNRELDRVILEAKARHQAAR